MAVRPSGQRIPTPSQDAKSSTPAPSDAKQKAEETDFSVISTFYSGGSYGMEIREEEDVSAELSEHVVISYANGQIDAARSTLESLVRDNNDPGALKLWAMLFDLLRLQGDRKTFDALGLQFARVCELSPPSWAFEVEQTAGADEKQDSEQGERVALQGALIGDDPLFDNLLQAMSQGLIRTLDFGRLVGLDGEGAIKLARVLSQARRRGLAWGIEGASGLAGRLGSRTVSGQRQNEPLWILLLELYQFLSMEKEFEEKALDYAITFEVSPPSWEILKAPMVAPKSESAPKVAAKKKLEEAATLKGEILEGKLDEIKKHLTSGKECKLDFSGVTRMDFASANALAELLRSSGNKSVMIYHPNILVAELMRMVGIDQTAQIELSKY